MIGRLLRHWNFLRWPARLRGQAYSHLALVLLIATGGILLIGTVSFSTINDRDIKQREVQLREHYLTVLPRLESSWHAAAVQMRSRIEFLRILEEPAETGFPKLTAFLNAQWTLSEFSNLVVLDRDNRVIYHHGSESLALQNLVGDQMNWIYAPEFRQLYRVFQVSVWLGARGEGRLLLFKSLSNAMLRDLVIPQTHLQLWYLDQHVGQSHDAPATAGVSALQIRIPWPLIGSGGGPVLEIQREMNDLLTYSSFIIRPIAVIAFIAVLLWLGLGRWLAQTAQRIEGLGKSASLFAAGARTAALADELALARLHADEIGETAQAFVQMAEVVEKRDIEQQSYLETLSLLEEAVIELDRAGVVLRASPGWGKLTHCDENIGREIFESVHPHDVGQVLDDESEADRILEYGDTIGANRDDMTEALKSVKRMTTSQFQDICSFLFLMARQLSQLALNNYLKSQEIQRREWAERILHERNEKLVESYRKLEEQDRQLHFLAYHDLLTGLPGRAMFRERLDMACRLVRRSGRKVAVLYMDIDNFKQINDSFGHGIGDEILIEAGRRLLARIREYDTIARYGGDEFLAVLQDVETPEEILSLATRLHSAFAEPFVTTRVQYHCDISVGIAVYPDDGATVDELLKNADTAMYKAKDKGRNDIQFFNASMREEVLRQSEIERSLWSAMDQQAFFLQYQPQFDVASGAIRGFEALIRWHSPELGLISPLGFIPVAEDTGLIVPIGRWVLLEACRQAQVWNRHAPAPLIMAVNLSAVQLRSAGFLETVLDVLRETGLAPQLLELEITEIVLIHDYDMVVSTLQRLRDAGVRIALDDFGTGYSSLSYLKNLPIHMLKIDKAFIEDVCVNPTVCRITESIISLVQKLGIQTVAEGIEDENQFQCLKDIHCDFAQGFHLGRPMDADQVRMPIQPTHHG